MPRSTITWPLQIERTESCGIAVMLFDVITELLTQRRLALDDRADQLLVSRVVSLHVRAGALSFVYSVPNSVCACERGRKNFLNLLRDARYLVNDDEYGMSLCI